MGMFDSLSKKEERKELEREEREKNFIREQKNMDYQDDYTTLMQQDTRSDLLKWQQDLDDEIEKLKYRLRSFEKTDKGWQPKKIDVHVRVIDSEGNEKIEIRKRNLPPLANEIFIDYIESQVEPFVSRNLINSNFNEKRILEILKFTCNDIVSAMADGWDLYGIDFINYDLVLRLIKNTIIPGPFRALNNGQRLHDRSVNRRLESFNEVLGQQKRKGLLGVFS